MIADHSPIPIQDFNGLYGIDSYIDSVPYGYFIDELNTITFGSELKTRDGFALSLTTSAIIQHAIYRRQGESARVLALIGDTIWDLTTTTQILTVAGMTGFAINYANNRAFISPHNGVSGLPGSFVYVYNGTGTARKAAGNSPIAGFTASISGNAGVIESGLHIFAWVFETDSGFVTAPSAAQTLTFDGTKAVNFTNIPTGPAGTAKRRLIASRAIQSYNGNEQGYEMFFVAGGNIENNVDTTLSDVDFFDADLQLSADYVYDQLPEIPAVVFIVPYGHRLAFGGPNTDKNLVYISKALEPESIHSSAGFISYDPFETEGVKDATEFRDNFYVTKRTKTYTVRDNGYEPSTWRPVTIDSAIGCDINGIGRFLDTTGSRVEFFVVASPSGVFKFSGIYEEIPISRNIKNWWDRYNKTYLNRGQLIFDQERMRVYILVTLDGAVSPNFIIVGNYENGFTNDRIKWHLWSFADFSPSSISIDRDANRKTVLKVSSLSGNIYAQEDNRRNDVLTAINHYVRFALVGQQTNSIHHFGAVGLRIAGSGDVEMELRGQDNVDFQDLGTITLSANPGHEYIRDAYLNTEKASLRLALNNVGSYMRIKRINIYVNVIFNSRPNV
jgi:hypothetical protein